MGDTVTESDGVFGRVIAVADYTPGVHSVTVTDAGGNVNSHPYIVPKITGAESLAAPPG